MNTNTKYYTPEFHEFHEGFEYEDGFTFADFSHRMFSYNEIGRMDRSLFLKALDNKQIRVKHLDQEDCISLGLKLKVWHAGSGYFEYGDFTIGINTTGIFCIITQNDNGNNIVRFSGDLKNKSELQRIMSQTGIKE